MHTRIASLFFCLFFASFVAATAVRRDNPHNQQPTESCTTGSLQCCDSVQDSQNLSLSLTSLLGLLGIIVGDLTGLSPAPQLLSSAPAPVHAVLRLSAAPTLASTVLSPLAALRLTSERKLGSTNFTLDLFGVSVFSFLCLNSI
ncbi:hypothetical protein AMATHDRAFT_6469 [Amanita thiersii Skay4041]|uniref:Hydrophobin n=1 Tax=Amanita thiersii Skay4041 TaxID=703135 RepID=A0A2A9NJ49_9AGAR|nr:hypothetical protein AMATHDRAFT_6469 [Amanita thiersii Skay4041]